MIELKEMLESLNDMAKATNANMAHCKVETLFGEEKTVSVVSIYRGIKPSNEVLDELEEWLENNNMEYVLEKIKEISTCSLGEQNEE